MTVDVIQMTDRCDYQSELAVPVVVGEAWRPRQGSVCLHSLHSKKDNDHQIQSAGDHCRSLPHDRPGATEHRRGAQIQRRLHGMGMDRQLSTIPSSR